MPKIRTLCLEVTLLCWSVSTADKIRALQAFLGPGWCPLWERENGRDRLVFLSPQLIARYKQLSEPFYSHGIWEEEPEYHIFK